MNAIEEEDVFALAFAFDDDADAAPRRDSAERLGCRRWDHAEVAAVTLPLPESIVEGIASR
jgi:hypothetical protein